MQQSLAKIALVVHDYDDAIEFYTKTLDFTLIEDTRLSDTKRWVVVAPPGDVGSCLLLAKAASDQQAASVGNQAGGRVFLFLFTDDFWRDFNNYKARNVEFVREPVEEPFGTVAVFKDLYGNMWDLIQPNEHNKTFAARFA